MEKCFNIVAKGNKLLGKMIFRRENTNEIVKIQIEQSFCNNLRVIDIWANSEGKVEKYQLEIHEWPCERKCYHFVYDEKRKGYVDKNDYAFIYLEKQLIFESFYIVPEKIVNEINGIIKIFDFSKSLHTKILFKTESDNNFNYIQITAPACIKMTFDKNNSFVRYDDINSQISYIKV